MADLIADYDAKQADVQMASPEEGILLFLTDRGWVGVTLSRDDLVRVRDRISQELDAQLPPVRRR